MIYPHVWEKIPDEEVGESKLLVDEVKRTGSDCKTDIREEDQFTILSFIQRTRRREMVDSSKVSILLSLAATFNLAFVVVVPSNIGKQVHPPSKHLLSNHVCSSCNGGLLHQLRQFMHQFSNSRGVFLTSLWEEDHVALHVSSSFVVFTVRNLPGKVRDEESRMENPSNSVVEDF